jgi:hypothetical protein
MKHTKIAQKLHIIAILKRAQNFANFAKLPLLAIHPEM